MTEYSTNTLPGAGLQDIPSKVIATASGFPTVMNRCIYQEIASRVQAIENCRKSGNTEWGQRHEQEINHIVKNHMPSGSGIDHGTVFELSVSNAEKLVFTVDYHHMNESGMYDGWTCHEVVVTPSLAHGFTLKIKGINRNDIKEYLYDIIRESLSESYMPETVAQ